MVWVGTDFMKKTYKIREAFEGKREDTGNDLALDLETPRSATPYHSPSRASNVHGKKSMRNLVCEQHELDNDPITFFVQY